MKTLEASQLLSEAMVVGEHPAEPMVIHVSAQLSSDFPFKKYALSTLIEKTELFLRDRKRLCSSFDLSKECSPLVVSKNYGEMAKEIWSSQDLDLNSFREQRISPQGKSLIRFKLSEESGFYVAVHHGLLDGRGLFHLLNDFLAHLMNISLAETAVKNANLDLTVSLWNKLQFVCQKIKEFLLPPVMLSPCEEFAGSKAYFYSKKIPYSKVKNLLKDLRSTDSEVNLNDLLLSSFQKTLAQKSGKKFGGRRQALMMPVDLRRHGRWDAYDNLSSSVCIDVNSGDLNDSRKLLASTKKKVRKAVKSNFDILNLNLLSLIRGKGVLDDSRKFLEEKGLPRRCFKDGDKFWRFASTAIFANMGSLRFHPKVKDYVRSVEGFPAVISPTSMAVTALVYDDLVLNFRASSTGVETLEELVKFADLMESNLWSFASV